MSQKNSKVGRVNELFTSGISELPPVGSCGVSDILRMSHTCVSRWPQGRQAVQVLFLRVGGLEGGGAGKERLAPGAVCERYGVYKRIESEKKGNFSHVWL